MSRSSWALRTELTLDEVNVHLPALEAAGLLGIDEAAGRATLWFSERPAKALPVDGAWEEVPDHDWNAAWRDALEPVVVGRVAVVPPWWRDRLPAADGAAPDIVLRIEPAQAFGTGHHETTAHCLRALQQAPVDGARVLDVGTGTGVLALAALRLGATTAVGVDTDPIAVATAAANAHTNLADASAFGVHAGSVEAAPSGRYDLVLANLDTATLTALADELAARVAPRGLLIASGVSLPRIDEAAGALEASGLRVRWERGHEWGLLVGMPSPGDR